eukprot:1149364-Pelagomonas_calceolata.AAC.7
MRRACPAAARAGVGLGRWQQRDWWVFEQRRACCWARGWGEGKGQWVWPAARAARVGAEGACEEGCGCGGCDGGGECLGRGDLLGLLAVPGCDAAAAAAAAAAANSMVRGSAGPPFLRGPPED